MSKGIPPRSYWSITWFLPRILRQTPALLITTWGGVIAPILHQSGWRKFGGWHYKCMYVLLHICMYVYTYIYIYDIVLYCGSAHSDYQKERGIQPLSGVPTPKPVQPCGLSFGFLEPWKSQCTFVHVIRAAGAMWCFAQLLTSLNGFMPTALPLGRYAQLHLW